ncbi:MAG TPA: hypothetical protein VHM48_09030 [Candidatus Limnocylindrales bacterium]|nr:hypothetical protein [Candidatus Limnocylindrales bacterium]
MLIIWRGWGLLAILFPLISVLVANVVVDVVAGAGAFGTSSVGPGLGLVAAGTLCWVTGRRVNGEPVPYLGRSVADGQPFRPRLPFLFARHNFLFVPLEAWGVLFFGLGLLAVVRGVLHV